MKFSGELITGHLLRRYKRFLVDVELDDGRIVTAHTANTGAMTGCAQPGSRVWLSLSSNPKRKYPLTWELVQVDNEKGKTLIGINTMRSNALAIEAIQGRLLPSLCGYHSIKSEVAYGKNSRIDLLLQREAKPEKCFIEVKNVTLVQGTEAYFPDAISARAVKHLQELVREVREGSRAVMFFCVQREDVDVVRPAEFIDLKYASAFRCALQNGVEAVACSAKVCPAGIVLIRQIDVASD